MQRGRVFKALFRVNAHNRLEVIHSNRFSYLFAAPFLVMRDLVILLMLS